MEGNPRRAVVAVAGLLCGTLLVTACGADDEPRSLPTLPASSSSATPSAAAAQPSNLAEPSTEPTPTAKARTAEEVYLGWVVHFLASQDRSKLARRKYLGRWLVDPALTEHVEAIQQQLDQHIRMTGRRTPHVFAVDTDGGTVTVQDCADIREQVLEDTRTGRAIGGEQPDFLWTTATLVHTEHGWRISELTASEKPCVHKLGSGSPAAGDADAS